MRLRDLARKKIAIWGTGREGMSVCRLLRKRLPDLRITLLNDSPVSSEQAAEISGDKALSLKTGDRALRSLAEFDAVFKSPGISLYRPEIDEAKQKGTVFTSATRLWFAEHPNEKTICVTGTKGKSTTTSLIAHLLRSKGLNAAKGGNIGVPITEFFGTKPSPDVWVFELSSYQTADFEGVPSAAVLLNLFPEHLDWHGDTDTYYWDKLNLFRHMKNGLSVLNHLDPVTSNTAFDWHNPIWFNRDDGIRAAGGYIRNGREILLPVEKIRLPGIHNLSNVCAALAAVRAVGIDPKACVDSIPKFGGLPHRLRIIGESGGVRWVDDSISTTPQSAIAAVKAFPGRKITLLAGGFDRGLDMDGLAKFLVSGPCHAVVAMPASGRRIAEILRRESRQATFAVHESESLEHAVEIAEKITPKGGIVLLSPAAPSYGEFKDYRERGKMFAEFAGFPQE